MEPDIILRPHHLLCLLSFSGEGYSREFEAEFARLAKLYARPGTLLEVVAGPDMACQTCPHLANGVCTSPADGPDQRVQALDNAILALLGLTPGIHRAGAIHACIAACSKEQLAGVCADCSWHPQADCQTKIKAKV
jgi:uncharacterized protein